MTVNVGRSDHNRCSLRMCKTCDGRHLARGRPTLARRHASGGSQLKCSRLQSTIAAFELPPPRAPSANPSLHTQARN
jgi:hypothetical protein